MLVEFCLSPPVMFLGFFVYSIVEYLPLKTLFHYATPTYIITPIGILFGIGCSTDSVLRQKTKMY